MDVYKTLQWITSVLPHQDLVGVAESSFQGQRKLSQVSCDELGLRDDGCSLVQTLLPDLPVLVPDLRHQVTCDLVTGREEEEEEELG